jgi:hypothetical protein
MEASFVHPPCSAMADFGLNRACLIRTISFGSQPERTLFEHIESASPRMSGHEADMPGLQLRANS